MQTKKLSLANIQGKLSRTEMKNVMAGTGCVVVCGGNTYWIATVQGCGAYGYIGSNGNYVTLCQP